MQRVSPVQDIPRNRPLPLVVVVPPPEDRFLRPLVEVLVGMAVGMCLLGGAAFLVLAIGAKKALLESAFFTGVFWLSAALMIRWGIVSNRRHRESRDETLRALSPDGLHPLAVQFAREWRHQPFTPETSTLLRIARDFRPLPPGGLIVCLGTAPPRECGEIRFEPEIVRSTEAFAYQFRTSLPFYLLFAFLWVRSWGSIPVWFHPAAALAAFAVYWTWRGFLRPRYIRMAPGLVQVMQYSYSNNLPRFGTTP